MKQELSRTNLGIMNSRTPTPFDELDILHTLAQVITKTTDEDQLIEQVTKLFGDNQFSDNFGILLVDEKDGVLRVHPSCTFNGNLSEKVVFTSFEGSVIWHVAKTGNSERVPDVTAIPNCIIFDLETRSKLVLPLNLGKTTIGVINAESKIPNGFSDSDERFLVILASQISMTIAHLRAAKNENRYKEQTFLRDAFILLSSTLDYKAVLKELTRQLCLAVDATSAYINEVDEKQGVYISIAEYISPKAGDEEKVSDLGEPYPMSLSSEAVGGNSPIDEFQWVEELRQGIPDVDHFDDLDIPKTQYEEMEHYGVKSILYIPLIAKGQLVGFSEIWESRHKKEFSDAEINLCTILSQQAVIALENAHMFDQVKHYASHDELTGLYNRRWLLELAQAEFNRCIRYDRSISLLMLDIDNFKNFNDTYGHAIGDEVLQAVANFCKESMRDSDFLGRYGGEEFVLVLTETLQEEAKIFAERLRKNIAKTMIPTDKGELSVTVSIGLAENDGITPNLEKLIDRADQAMYVAKKKGRNRIVVGA
ncbi:MAG: sensor domain-containing diguanylate cyclase [Anaerolineae bacterium]|jgi:diguanylate cyclase (GGDEF)-like protein|nr:sensor domain-containing diguanylate cyclase [Anaerolineae bacterium]MBT4459571.1 sensor domain-containing diguanylate cyclase [Anaerolineae bacterium]MBT6060145.1 sensor domain-containing diguanylate cyclase [Anaerolineae bacterium]MBT6323672.1 sensor domain-containing diguanylate cyclase [Anaerolineae bacterium]MBT6814515.1 sensor domain-containing diguanylate cyclase [Anaerolineae bacterium]